MRLFLLLLIGCPKSAPAPSVASQEVAVAAEVAPVEVAPELAPFPYTPDQIRDTWVMGLRITWAMNHMGSVEGQLWEVTSHDAESVGLTYWTLDDAGEPVGEAQSDTSTWEQLRDHASFAADLTEVHETELETPWGPEPVLHYVVTDGAEVREFFFGLNTPGAPLRHTLSQDGEVVFDMVQIRRETP